MALLTVQKRGGLTIPAAERAQLGWQDGQLVLTTVVGPDHWCVHAIPDADTLWARYPAEPGDAAAPPPTTAGGWIPVGALRHAAQEAASPWRSIWQALSRGLTQRRCDPTTLTAWADQMPAVWPAGTRADHAAILQAICAWPGVVLPDRDFWLTVCAAWGQADLPWSEVVWQVRNAADPPAAESRGGEPS